MTQPTFALPCEYGLEVTRRSYGQRIKLAATSGTASPSTDELGVSAYEITTVPIGNDTANSLDAQLQALKGSYFYSQFYFDDQQYKYRIVDDTWTWEVIGPTANVFTLNVERLYEPTVEFALDYQIEQSQSITRNFLKIATSSGTAIPSINSATIKRSAITTRPLSSDGAVSLRDTLQNLAGTTFFAKLYLDDVAKRYRVVDNSWNVGAAGANGAVFDFELEEVLNLGADIPISIAPTTSARKNYGQRIKIAATSGNAVPSTDAISIDEYSIETASVTPTQASGLTTSLQNLKGSFFYAKIFDNPAAKKYSLVNDEWSQEFSNQDSVIFRFDIREVYEPTVEFAIDYQINQTQNILKNFLKIGGTSGQGTPSIETATIKRSQITTRPLSKVSAQAIIGIIEDRAGTVFFSQLYLDSTPKRYRFVDGSWSISSEGEDSCSISFELEEVVDEVANIPLSIETTSSSRQSYGTKIKLAAASGSASPSSSGVTINEYGITTYPLSPAQASGVESSLIALQGDSFFAKIFDDPVVAKYVLVNNQWNKEFRSKDSVQYNFTVKQLHEPTVEFAIDYNLSQGQSVTRNFLKLASVQGSGTPSVNSITTKSSRIRTVEMSKTSAESFTSTLSSIGGTVFWSKLHLDSTPKKYRLVNGEWSIDATSENQCAIEFELEEVITASGDIPIAISPTSSKRSNYGQLIKIASTSGTATPSGTKPTIRQYSITTAALNPSEASGVTSDLEGIAGSFFYGKIFDDASEKKYCLVDDEWTQEFSSKDGVVFQFDIREVYEPSLEFAIDYGQSQEQSVSAHVFRIASSSGTATPSITSKSIKTASVRTRPMSLTAARGLETILLNLNGDSFYSKIYLDNTPRAYRLQPNQWSWTPEGEDMYSCSFTMAEVLANSTDIPCVASLNLERRTRIKKVQFGDGYEQNAPDGVNVQDYIYSIETLPLSDTQAASVESSLSNLEGDFFYAKFTNDSQVYKYRLNESTWTWRSDGPESNVFVFKVKRAYDL